MIGHIAGLSKYRPARRHLADGGVHGLFRAAAYGDARARIEKRLGDHASDAARTPGYDCAFAFQELVHVDYDNGPGCVSGGSSPGPAGRSRTGGIAASDAQACYFPV